VLVHQRSNGKHNIEYFLGGTADISYAFLLQSAHPRHGAVNTLRKRGIHSHRADNAKVAVLKMVKNIRTDMSLRMENGSRD
jgi:hypothetical protein